MDSARPIGSDGHVLVIGSAGIDVRARPDTALQNSTITPGYVRFSVGGVARNIAENLARLEIPTVLLTAVGDDGNGQIVLDRCSSAGIDCSHIPRVPAMQTGGSITLMTEANDIDTGIFDYGVIEHVNRDL